MFSIFLQAGVGQELGNVSAGAATQLISNPIFLIGGIILIVATVLLLFFLKRIIVNSILGLIGWAIVYFLLGIKLPLIPSLVISIIFGLAGIGVMLVLAFFGLLQLG